MICPVTKRIDERKRVMLDRPVQGVCKPTVKVGQKVSDTEIIAHCELSAGQRLLKIAHVLGVSRGSVEKHLTRKVGDRIYEGEIIARKRGIFGLAKKEIKAPVDGLISEIDSRGDLIIKFLPKPVRLISGAAGEVKGIADDKISIMTTATKIHGFVSVGKLREGLISIVASPRDFIIPASIKADSQGKILVGGALLEKSALEKAVTIGAAAIITGGMNYRDFESLANGGDFGTTVMITESFGSAPMGDDIWQFFSKKQGHLGFISGEANQAIVPEATTTGDEKLESPGTWRQLRVGDKVRYLRKESSDLLGEVKDLPGEQIINSGILTEVAQVSFTSGQDLLLPAANLQIIDF